MLLAYLLFGQLFANETLFSPEVSPAISWEYINQTPHQRSSLPFTKVSYRDFFSRTGEDLLLKDSKRTVESGHHFITPQRKLIFPMGVCLRGMWSIDDHQYPYTGYFRAGSQAVVIARAATSLHRIYYHQPRTLALSGKVFPTTNVNEINPLPAANFLLMNDNAGVRKEYFTEAFLTNAAPTTITPASVSLALIGYYVGNAFNASDKRRDMRQLYQIAELGDLPPYDSPHWMVMRGKKQYRELSHQLKKEDYRDEVMDLIDQNQKIEFDIFVSKTLINDQPVYDKIGSLSFDQYAASKECDESLHFQHPPYLESYTMPELDQNMHDNESLNQ